MDRPDFSKRLSNPEHVNSSPPTGSMTYIKSSCHNYSDRRLVACIIYMAPTRRRCEVSG